MENSLNDGIGVDFHAEFRGKATKGGRHGIGASFRIPYSFTRLHMRDRAEDGRGIVGRRADILSKMVDHLGDARLRYKGTNGGRGTAAHSHPEDVPKQRRPKNAAPVDHVKEAANRSVEKEVLRNAMEPLRELDEVGITFPQITGR